MVQCTRVPPVDDTASSDTYTAIPRLMTKKPPSYTLTTTIEELQSAIGPITVHASISEGRSIITTAANLTQDLYTWADDKGQGDQAELVRCKVRTPARRIYVPKPIIYN